MKPQVALPLANVHTHGIGSDLGLSLVYLCIDVAISKVWPYCTHS